MVLCPCGHTMDAHDRAGCAGDRRLACRCARDRYAALEDAVDAARRGAEGAQVLRRQVGARPQQ
jgi:hypothetical protein